MGKLRTEINTPNMEIQIMEAAEAILQRSRLCADFEHGQVTEGE